ncbi:hypothetical protein GYB22_06840 [bacterium]|nr:hypothetical protein [bacterium]
MKKIFVLFVLILSIQANAQMRFNAVGLAFDFNGGYNLTHSGLSSLVNAEFNDFMDENKVISVNRVMVAYRFNFRPENKDFFRFETDLLQGTEYLDFYDYESSYTGDTNYYKSSGFNNQAAVLGARLKAKFNTPVERRFHFNVGIAAEYLYMYNSNAEADVYVNYSTPQNYFNDQAQLSETILDNYTTFNLLQQAGMAFRFSEKEEKFPLNKTYLEFNFNVLTNFTTINSVTASHRSYGLSLGLVYEVK